MMKVNEWIPTDVTNLNSWVTIAVRHGNKRRTSHAETRDTTRESGWSDLMRKHLWVFFSIMYPLSFETKIPRPLSIAAHKRKPNEVLRVNIVHMKSDRRSEVYVLSVVEDDCRLCTLLCPSKTANNKSATSALAKKNSWYKCLQWLATDGRITFKTTLIEISTR